MTERSGENVKVEGGLTFTCTRDIPFAVSISFTRVKCTCAGAEKIHDSGNPPLERVDCSFIVIR